MACASVQECLECLKELLRVDRAWLPEKEGFRFAFSCVRLGLCVRQECQHMHPAW